MTENKKTNFSMTQSIARLDKTQEFAKNNSTLVFVNKRS